MKSERQDYGRLRYSVYPAITIKNLLDATGGKVSRGTLRGLEIDPQRDALLSTIDALDEAIERLLAERQGATT